MEPSTVASSFPLFWLSSFLSFQVLRFFAYFKEDCQYSAKEVYRVRPVVIYYYLLDNTMEMYEPAVENSGIPQGKRIKRHCFPKNEHGETYLWKDLNIDVDIEVYGVKYRITHCDEFTKVRASWFHVLNVLCLWSLLTKTVCVCGTRGSWSVEGSSWTHPRTYQWTPTPNVASSTSPPILHPPATTAGANFLPWTARYMNCILLLYFPEYCSTFGT